MRELKEDAGQLLIIIFTWKNDIYGWYGKSVASIFVSCLVSSPARAVYAVVGWRSDLTLNVNRVVAHRNYLSAPYRSCDILALLGLSGDCKPHAGCASPNWMKPHPRRTDTPS